MTLRLRAKVLLHVWSYDFYNTTFSTGKQRRHMINNFIIISITFVFFFTVIFFFSFFYFIFDDFFLFINFFFNLDLYFHLFYFLRGYGGFAAAGSVGVRNQHFEIC